MSSRRKRQSIEERNQHVLRHGRLTRTDERELRKEFRGRYYDDVVTHHFAETRRGRSAASYGNVVGFGFGEKMTEGKFTGDAALVVYVKKKAPPSRLKATRVPRSIDGLPTDVIELGGDVVAISSLPSSLTTCAQNPAARQPRPFPAGVSVGGGDLDAGSIGYRVRRADISGQLVLSNFHVLGPKTTAVFQPGFGDGVDPDNDQIGEVVGAVPLKFNGDPNSMDAAVARVATNVCLPAICRFGRLTGFADPAVNDVVRIHGKTTRRSLGFIQGSIADLTVSFGAQSARFVDQLVVARDPQSPAPIAAGGDSGSIVVKAPAIACALLFAAVTNGNFAFATPIERVMSRFRMDLFT